MLDTQSELSNSQKDFIKFLLVILSLLLWIVPIRWAFHAEFDRAIVPVDVLMLHKQNQADRDQIVELNKVDNQLVIQMQKNKERYQLAFISNDKKDKLSHNNSIRLLNQIDNDKIMHKDITKRIKQLHHNINKNYKTLWYATGFSELTLFRRFWCFFTLWTLLVVILFIQMYEAQFGKEFALPNKKLEESKE